MAPYDLTLLCHLVALAAHLGVMVAAFGVLFRHGLTQRQKAVWILLAGSALLLALPQARWLARGVSYGLYDLAGGVQGAAAAILLFMLAWLLRPASGTLPPQ